MTWQGYPVAVRTPRGEFTLLSSKDHARMVASCRHPQSMEFQPKGAAAHVRGCAGCLTVALAPLGGVWES